MFNHYAKKFRPTGNLKPKNNVTNNAMTNRIQNVVTFFPFWERTRISSIKTMTNKPNKNFTPYNALSNVE